MRATKLRATFVSIIAILSASATEADNWQPNRVAVIDTGLDIKSDYYKPFLCKDGHKDFTGMGIQDDDGHGTKVVDLIVRNSNSNNFCLVIYKFFTRKLEFNSNEALISALKEIKTQRIPVANLSLSGAGYIGEEEEEFAKNKFTIFVVAAGNDGVNLDDSPRYPASYEFTNVWAVGALDKYTNQKLKISNYGKRVRHWEKESATSYATAVKTGKLIRILFGDANGVF